MSTVGWAAAVIGFLTSIFGVLRLVFDQIPGLSESAIKAIESVRKVRQALRGHSAKGPSQADEQAEQQSP